ncbi:MAG: CoA transferase subunit A [Dehalococcoidia bacterium]|nr:MAG: CoA transferase subunit A [Dehalococcoidia bacterium]
MEVLQEGQGKLIGWHDPDENREYVLHNKSRALTDKTTTAKDAVSKFVKDGDIIASGGFAHCRVSMNIVYEIIRQKRRNLTMCGKTAVHDLDVLIGNECISEVEAAYSFGHEVRGLSAAGRRMVEGGKCKVVAEISNAGYQWRFLAGMMGVPFIPSRNLVGTDTFKYSSAKVVKDPWSGKPVTLLPAIYPDVAFIHVHRADIYGNCQIDGIMVEDFELARCARKLIITTEKIIDNDIIRATPWQTVIPFYLVDAVVEQRYGAHPCEMHGEYFFDEEHIAEWLAVSKTEEGTKKYAEKYIFGTEDFDDYLAVVGGFKKLDFLIKREEMRVPLYTPWRK